MRRLIAVAVALLGIVQASPAYAEALLRITPLGMPAASYPGPTSPVQIGGNGFRLTYHSKPNGNGNKSQSMLNPVMLIFGIPNLALTAPAVTAGAMSGGFTSVAVDLGDTQSSRYGGSWNSTTGFAGNFNSTTNPKVYEFIGFPNGSDSQNYTNWSTASGFASWNLFVYALTFSPAQLQSGNYVEFSTSLPKGSFVIGYGCQQIDNNGLCTVGGLSNSTPFTFAGHVTQVSEPGTLAIVGIGLIAATFGRRRLCRANQRHIAS